MGQPNAKPVAHGNRAYPNTTRPPGSQVTPTGAAGNAAPPTTSAPSVDNVALFEELNRKRPTAVGPPAPAAAATSLQPISVPVVIRYKAVATTRTVPGGPAAAPSPASPSTSSGGASASRGGPREVKVLIASLQWKPIALTRSGDDFVHIMSLPPGTHLYKFRVDGVDTVDESLPKSGECNVLHANPDLLTARDEDDAAGDAAGTAQYDDSTGWGQVPHQFEESRKFPAILPLHLRYTPLNAPPTQFRCDADGVVSPVGAINDGAPADRDALPLPLSVTINHVYFQKRDDHTVMGTTLRYRNKFVSIVYYKAG